MLQSVPITDIQEFVLSNPELTAVLITVLYTLLRLQKTLPYRQYRFLHLGKSMLFRLLDKQATAYGRPLIRPKNEPENSDEYITTVDTSPRQTYKRLRENGCSPHLIATVKSRPHGSTMQFSHSQLVKQHSDGTQTEYYLFPASGGTDIYGHTETSVLDPSGHVSDSQTKAELPENF